MDYDSACLIIEMANTKLTKRKEEGSTQQVESGSDSEPKLPQNQGNGDLVVDDLSHVHNKCNHLMAKLKALNQAAANIPTASVVTTLPFVTPIVTTVHSEGAWAVEGDLSKVAVTADAVSENLINYLTGGQVAVDTNISLEVENSDGDLQLVVKENEAVQPIEATVIINKAGIHQPLRPIREMLNELDSGQDKSRKRDDHIQESNIIVSTLSLISVFLNLV